MTVFSFLNNFCKDNDFSILSNFVIFAKIIV